jgi:glutamate-1-semialdehyde 2,1-aminomutase
LGKVIGGGLPVGAYAGKRQIMETVAPAGPMYQAGTLSGNPLAMTAGLVTLQELTKEGVFESIAQMTLTLVDGIQSLASEYKIPLQIGWAGSMFGFYFLKEAGTKITDYASAKAFADTTRYGQFFHAMLERGVYFAPSQFEAGFLSSAHTEAEIAQTLTAFREVVSYL